LSLVIFDKACKPFLDECGEANRQAAERAVGRIKELIAQYRRGISPFTDDITSIGTRLGILTRMPGQWWYSDNRVRDYVQRKFEQHLFGEEKLKADISGVLLAYREDVQSNQNRMLGSVRASLEREKMPGTRVPKFVGYASKVRQEIVQFSGKGATGTVYNGIASLVLCEVASVAAEQLVVRIIATFGTAAATSAAASGGATAGGAAAGGGTGTLAGPVGTAIGVGVGLVIGVIVDWWMTERFRGHLAEDLNAYFDKLEVSILEGDGKGGGVRKALADVSTNLTSAQERVLRQTLLEGTQ
jgi:hypothetical protein